MRVIHVPGRAAKDEASPVRLLRFAPHGRELVAVCAGQMTGDAVWWDLLRDGSAARLSFGIRGFWNALSCVAISPDARWLAVVEDDIDLPPTHVRAWDRDGDRRRFDSPSGSEHLNAVAYSPDGKVLVATVVPAYPHGLVAWEVPSGSRPVRSFELDLSATHVAVAGGGAAIAASGEDGLVVVSPDPVEPPGYRRRWLTEYRTGTVTAFTPDDRLLAAADGTKVLIFDWRHAEQLAALSGHDGLVTALAFSPDGRTLATASLDGTVRFWDAETWRERARFAWGLSRPGAVAFSPDGLTCAAGGENGRVVLWDVDG